MLSRGGFVYVNYEMLLVLETLKPFRLIVWYLTCVLGGNKHLLVVVEWFCNLCGLRDSCRRLVCVITRISLDTTCAYRGCLT